MINFINPYNKKIFFKKNEKYEDKSKAYVIKLTK